MQRTQLFWAIVTVDRTTRQIGRREVYADNADIPAEQFAELFAVYKSPLAAAKFRHLFKEGERPDLNEVMHFSTVPATPTRHEDEAGNYLTEAEFMDIVVGRPVMIAGNAGSVTRFGPSDMVKRRKWNKHKANRISHFLDVVFYIQRSPWMQTDAKIEYFCNNENDLTDKVVFGYTGPDIYTLASVLGFVRQLHANEDRLFDKACNAYLEHCANHAKAAWVQLHKVQFKEVLDSPVMHCNEHTGREILDLFLYGFGFMHPPKSAEQQEPGRHSDRVKLEDFRKLIDARGPKTALIVFHFTLLNLTYHSSIIAAAMAQDFNHWMSNPENAKPTRVSMHELLGGTV